jgi:hypothetical protein
LNALKFVSSEKISVNGNELTGTMDLHTYYDLIFSAMSAGLQQHPASRAQEPTN